VLKKNSLISVAALLIISTSITGCGNEEIVEKIVEKKEVISPEKLKEIADLKAKEQLLILEKKQLEIEKQFKIELKSIIHGIKKYSDLSELFPETDSLSNKKGWNKTGFYIDLEIANNWYIQKYENKIIVATKRNAFPLLKEDFTINLYNKYCSMKKDKGANYCALLLNKKHLNTKEKEKEKEKKKVIKDVVITDNYLDGKTDLITNNDNEKLFIEELKFLINGLDKYYKESGFLPKTGSFNNSNSQLNRNSDVFTGKTDILNKWWLGKFSNKIVLELKVDSYKLVSDEYKRKVYKNYCEKTNKLQLNVCSLFLKR
jgi:hypothetical protein